MDIWDFGLLMSVVLLITILAIQVTTYHKCKYDSIQEGGFQYCKVCNKATQPLLQPCQCEWEREYKEKITNNIGNVVSYLHILKCKHCGDIKSVKTGI